jgi:hypothetical protein
MGENTIYSEITLQLRPLNFTGGGIFHSPFQQFKFVRMDSLKSARTGELHHIRNVIEFSCDCGFLAKRTTPFRESLMATSGIKHQRGRADMTVFYQNVYIYLFFIEHFIA